jgi:hypothetical protein
MELQKLTACVGVGADNQQCLLLQQVVPANSLELAPAGVLMVTTPKLLLLGWCAMRRGCSPRGTVRMCSFWMPVKSRQQQQQQQWQQQRVACVDATVLIESWCARRTSSAPHTCKHLVEGSERKLHFNCVTMCCVASTTSDGSWRPPNATQYLPQTVLEHSAAAAAADTVCLVGGGCLISPSMVPRLSCCPLTSARLSGKLAVVKEHRNAT